jgi:HK97 family phage portal protein
VTAAVFNLTAQQPGSRVLANWLAQRDGATQRAGLQPAPVAIGENATRTNLTAEELLAYIGGAAVSSAGVNVTADAAMCVATVYACVDRITGAIKSLPFRVFERVGEARKPADHDYNWFFNERANADMSSADAWTYLLGGKFFYGDGFAELLRPSISSSRVIGWQPLHPLAVQPFRDAKTQVKYYRVTRADGTVDVLDQADIVQLTSLGYDGLTSPSPITYAAREAVGAAIAGQQWSGRFFRDGATFDYALKTDSNLKAEQIETLRASLLSRQAGTRAPLILTGGLAPAQLSVNPKDAELLASRLFTVEEICRIFGVPPHLVGHTQKDSSWGTGMEQQGGNFVRYTLMSHLVQLAQEFNHKLWPVRQRFFVEHVTAALERGDLKSRNESHRVAIGRAGEPGWMSVNEVRRIENLPPIEGGDQLNQGAPNAQPTDPAAG